MIRFLICCFILEAFPVRAAVPTAPPRFIFSPAGNGSRKTISFVMNLPSNAEVSSWRFEIRTQGVNDAPGKLIKLFSGDGLPPRKITWDGNDTQNRVVQDGTYFYSLSLKTPAGNQAAITPSPVIVDRVPPSISASVSPSIFSPNGLKP